MKNGIFTLGQSDVGRGLLVAIFSPAVVAITVALGAIISATGFDVFAVDWGMVSHNLLNISIVAAYGGFMGYISKNFFSSNQGNVLGIGDAPTQ